MWMVCVRSDNRKWVTVMETSLLLRKNQKAAQTRDAFWVPLFIEPNLDAANKRRAELTPSGGNRMNQTRGVRDE